MDKAETGRGITGVVVWVALIVLCFFAVLVVYMLRRTSENETVWNRSVYIYGGVEAVTFAAAGFLFGREVNRRRAETAETRAEKNELKANAGQTLAEVIRVKAGKFSKVPPISEPKQPDLTKLEEAIHTDWSELLAIVNQHFT